jgi:DNA-binding HxlR family transcriptional regulator
LTGSTNGGGKASRSGTRALILLATPLNGTILRALSKGPKRLADLRRKCGSPAQTTLRAHVGRLEKVGTIARRRCRSFPGILEFELTGGGRELLLVAAILERWLMGAPHGPLRFGGTAAKATIKALVEGYSSTMLRALAAGPLSLTELDRVIGFLSYPALERRLTAMHRAGQVESSSTQGKGKTPYRVTEWLRRGVAPLAAGARWERRHLPADTAPVSTIDTEAAFLLALPLLSLPEELSGSCRMGVELSNDQGHRLAGAIATVEDGRIVSCTVRLNHSADAWIIGSVQAWLHATIDASTGGLELGGNQRLARGLLDGLHRAR